MGENGVSEIYVIKRNGRGREQLNIDKIHDMVEYACEDIKSVSASQVEMNSGLQFYDNIPTDQIQQILIKSASDRSNRETVFATSSGVVVRLIGFLFFVPSTQTSHLSVIFVKALVGVTPA